MKKINKTALFIPLVGVVLLIGIVIFTNTSQPVSAQRDVDCNTQNLVGAYSTAGFGTISAQNPVGLPPGPYNSAATLIHDGAGNYTFTSKTSYNGTLVDEEFTGAYTVAEGCRVTYFYQGAPAVYAIFTGNRQEARAVWTVPGMNVTVLTVKR